MKLLTILIALVVFTGQVRGITSVFNVTLTEIGPTTALKTIPATGSDGLEIYTVFKFITPLPGGGNSTYMRTSYSLTQTLVTYDIQSVRIVEQTTTIPDTVSSTAAVTQASSSTTANVSSATHSAGTTTNTATSSPTAEPVKVKKGTSTSIIVVATLVPIIVVAAAFLLAFAWFRGGLREKRRRSQLKKSIRILPGPAIAPPTRPIRPRSVSPSTLNMMRVSDIPSLHRHSSIKVDSPTVASGGGEEVEEEKGGMVV